MGSERSSSCGCQAANASRKASLRLVKSSRATDAWTTTVSFFVCNRCARRWRNEYVWRYPVGLPGINDGATTMPLASLQAMSGQRPNAART